MELLKDGAKWPLGGHMFLCKEVYYVFIQVIQVNEHTIYLIYKLIWTLSTLHCPFCVNFDELVLLKSC